MQKPIPPRRDFRHLELRRQRAARWFAAGKLSLAEIARELQVSRQSVSRWYAQWKKGGSDALRAAGRAGRKPKLNRQQLRQVEQALRQGARAHGFATDLWTLPRVARVIERLTGVLYHPGHVWKILRALDWSLQRPAKQARERKPEKVRRWLTQTWPEIKKKLAAAQESRHARLLTPATRLAHGGTLAGLCAGSQPGGDAVGKYQRTGTGQPLCRRPGGTGRGGPQWHGASRRF